DQFVVKPPLHTQELVIFYSRQEPYCYFKSARASATAAIVATGLSSTQRLFEKLIRIERNFARSHRTHYHLAITFEDDAVNDSRVYVLFGEQEVSSLRDRIAILTAKKAHAGDRIAFPYLPILERQTDYVHYLF